MPELHKSELKIGNWAILYGITDDLELNGLSVILVEKNEDNEWLTFDKYGGMILVNEENMMLIADRCEADDLSTFIYNNKYGS